MKKAGYCLIILTLVFSGFLGGFLLGRNYGSGDVKLSGQVAPAVEERTEPTEESITPSTTQGKININTATAEELTALPGIGNVLAQRIVDYRTTHGPFRSKDDLSKVTGIGEKKLEGIMQYVILSGS